MASFEDEEKLQRFVLWLETNGVQVKDSRIKHSHGKSQGLGVFSMHENNPGVLMVTPLVLAITPMSVLQNPDFGKAYGKLFDEGDVDDRLLVILFLMVERLRGSCSLWAPYLDVLPNTFGTPLWFTEKEMQELKGTNLFNATKIQVRNLEMHFKEKAKPFAQKLLSSLGVIEREIEFEDFLWANSIFWTRALNIPCPHSFVFPKNIQKDPTICNPDVEPETRNESEHSNCGSHLNPTPDEIDTVWVEGLVPGIDFCNHAPKALAHWEVDGSRGSVSGVPNSMYLFTDAHLAADEEILISYGNKGNEELLFLYGFVLENNPDDYFMVHFPKEILDQDPCSEAKIELIREQNSTLRWLLPSSLLHNGFYSKESISTPNTLECNNSATCTNYSWSGTRNPPSFLKQFVFPEDMIAALRIVSMREDELRTVVSMLEELSRTGMQKTPSGDDIKAAVWEVCGNIDALQLLTDLISAKFMELEEATGSEDSDNNLLSSSEGCLESTMTQNVRSCVIYRRGQKSLAKQFLREAERLLELSILEEQSGSKEKLPS